MMMMSLSAQLPLFWIISELTAWRTDEYPQLNWTELMRASATARQLTWCLAGAYDSARDTSSHARSFHSMDGCVAPSDRGSDLLRLSDSVSCCRMDGLPKLLHALNNRTPIAKDGRCTHQLVYLHCSPDLNRRLWEWRQILSLFSQAKAAGSVPRPDRVNWTWALFSSCRWGLV
jgi:hypothetical protein